MNEAVKTCVFLAAGLLAVGSAYLFDSRATTVDVQKLVGQTLNADNAEIDLTAPRRLQVVKFDQQTASVRQFEVAEVDGVWCIPSKDNYPADATQKMAEAATCVMDRKVLRIAGDAAETHEEFGVVDPLSAQLNSKSTGVGTRVIMTDAADATLIDLIIGNEVKDNPKQRYVRRSNQDVVYVVELDPTKLSTSFADWIEDHVLKLKAMDLRKTYINDYTADLSVRMGPQGLEPTIKLDPRSEITLVHDEESKPWEVASLKKRDPQRPIDRLTRGMSPDTLAADEEVNQDAVKGLVSALDDLLIVDVVRKPAGLSADLKAGEAFLNEEEALSDLVKKGFIPGSQDSGADMLSSEGEIVCTERNGVEYVLRFGQLQVQSDGGDIADAGAGAKDKPAGATAAAGDGAKAGAGENLRRYLFVMARFNEDAVEKPAYKELPELPPASEGTKTEDNATAKAGDAAATPAEGGATAATDEAKAADDSAGKVDEKGTEGDKKADDERAAIEAKRKEIEAENGRLRDEYQSLISAGQEEVADLNGRFGDWYFVISNDVYKKIHLGRGDVIKKKEAPKADGQPADQEPNVTDGLPDLGGGAIPAAPAAGK
jgi:hypothetical protein